MKRDLERLVRRRSGGRCEYCQVPESHDRLPFQIDHVIALKHRGPSQADNLCYACFACNNHKGTNLSGFDAQTGKVVRLFDPRRQRWSRHFRWEGPRLIGLTASGRVTVIVLEINLDHRIAFRRELIDEGIFPPDLHSR
jgi:hypothetical protein